jgi:hypothetical protein
MSEACVGQPPPQQHALWGTSIWLASDNQSEGRRVCIVCNATRSQPSCCGAAPAGFSVSRSLRQQLQQHDASLPHLLVTAEHSVSHPLEAGAAVAMLPCNV